jgi:phosphoribosyl 1,2-cyclic phosphodiesterase
VKLTFAGTRGYIKPKSIQHQMHTSTVLAYRGKKVMIDCGETWLERVSSLRLHAIVITHAHPDHAFGLKAGAPCPVYASAETWARMKSFPIRKDFRNVIKPRRPEKIEGITFEAFPVIHSVLAPAVGYRISAGKIVLFYVPDVAWIPKRSQAFSDVRVYIGDGATLTRPLIRYEKRSGRLIGHASIDTQLGWCRREGVRRMIVTHCGSAIVRGDEGRVQAKLRMLGRKYGVRTQVAYDGMELRLR